MQFEQQVNRHTPLGDPGAYVTYGIRAQRDVQVVAACKDVGCQAWAHGWETTVDENTELGRRQAAYIRHGSGREFTEHRTGPEGQQLTVFRFPAFQRCFAEHRTRPDLFLVRDGDWRGNPTGRGRVHARPQDWVEDFQEHEGALADLRQKG
jgi:hypothetical protein